MIKTTIIANAPSVIIFYFLKLIFSTAAYPKYLFIRDVISSALYDNCNAKAGFAGRIATTYLLSRVLRNAANRAIAAISGPIISSQRAAKSASDARAPNMRNNPPIAPPIVWGRARRLLNLFGWFDITVFFGH